VHFGQRFDPGGDAGGYLSLASGPSPDKAIIAFERVGETALRPALRGQTRPETFGCDVRKAPTATKFRARRNVVMCQKTTLLAWADKKEAANVSGI
jgi:hypothetical protein